MSEHMPIPASDGDETGEYDFSAFDASIAQIAWAESAQATERRQRFISDFRLQHPFYVHEYYSAIMGGSYESEDGEPGNVVDDFVDELLEYADRYPGVIVTAEQQERITCYKYEMALSKRNTYGATSEWIARMLDYRLPQGEDVSGLTEREFDEKFKYFMGRTPAQIDTFKVCALDLYLHRRPDIMGCFRDVTPDEQVAGAFTDIAIRHGMMNGRSLWEHSYNFELPIVSLLRRARLDLEKRNNVHEVIHHLGMLYFHGHPGLKQQFVQQSAGVATYVFQTFQKLHDPADD